ncbi:MAG: hypothetical protein CSA05_00305 [Bacteroidia bacterium]|nr:MAG: hypothetical protein CSB01_01195 [Bacteroidia bacterium]PIE86506.1 MAG: hypothetical protein CSA05_00305 [Bacteroidia bacterium]
MVLQIELQRAPFVRLVLPLIAGILLQDALCLSASLLIPFFSLVFAAAIFLLFAKFNTFLYAYRWISGFLIMLSVLLFGAILTFGKQRLQPVELPDDEQTYIARIDEFVKEKNKSYKTLALVQVRSDSAGFHPVGRKMLLYFEKDDAAKKLMYGDRILLHARPQTVKNANNPNEFDYKTYLSRQGIFYQAYVKSGNFSILERQQGFFIMQIAQNLRQKLMEIYKECGLEGQEFAIASALTLGYKDDLDTDTRRAFSAAGAMHVLAVSGLHVGVIFMILNFLFRFLQFSKITKTIRFVLIVCGLFFFAFITGLSPSVLRASIMFSIVQLAILINRNKNIYNTISISAFFMLVCNPYLIFNVGFQLSYTAVLSIVFFQPKFVRLYVPKNKILQHFWELVSLTLAAQIGTAPIGIYYFNMFPIYFIITNLFVVTLATFIVAGSFFVFLGSYVSVLSNAISFVFVYLIKTLNYIVTTIESLPFSTLERLHLNMSQLILLYIFIFLASLYFMRRSIKILYSLLTTLIVFFAINLAVNIRLKNNAQFVVYNINKASVFSILNNGKGFVFGSEQTLENESLLNFYISNNLTANKIKNENMVRFADFNQLQWQETQKYAFSCCNNFMKIKNKHFYILLNETLFHSIPNLPFEVNYLILTNKVRISIDEILNFISPEMIIIDSSVANMQKNIWKRECETKNIGFYSVKDSGAYVVEI